MIKVSKLLQHCKDAHNWRYIYGAKGTVLTKVQIQALQRQYGSNMVWQSDIKKAGYVCCDCSGLISSATGIIRGSSQYKASASKVLTIEEFKKHWVPGWAVWMNGHIGVASETVGYYYAMDGSARNWVHNPLSMNKFTHAFPICDVDYSESVTPTTEPSKTVPTNGASDQVAAYKDKSLNHNFTTTSDLNLRSGAGTNFRSKLVIPKGAKVRCYGFYNETSGTKWLYVSYNGTNGYCSSKYLK